MKRLIVLIFCAVAVSTSWTASTTTAGAQPHWVLQKSPTSTYLKAISCPSTTECWAVGGAIVKTRNSGKTWSVVHSSYVASHPRTLLEAIRCSVPRTCAVVAPPNTVLTTTNGGRTWRVSQIKLAKSLASISAIACPVPGVCYVTVVPSGNPETWFHHSGTIFKTADDGATWHQQSIPARVACPGDCGLPMVGYALQWISCVNVNACRAGGDTFIGSHEGYASALIRTNNAGSSWKLAHHNFDPDIGMCPTVTVCAGIFYEPQTPGPGPYLERTTNAGATWASNPAKTLPRTLDAIACSGPGFCELAGLHGAVAMSLDLHVSLQRSPTKVNLNGVACPSRRACYAVGSNGVILARHG